MVPLTRCNFKNSVILQVMSLVESLRALLDSRAYPHPCEAIELVETHISWVLLTGNFAYKLKKPVKFSFLDFSTLELREHFCREELRCNSAFAPQLYLGVLPVTREPDGTLSLGGDDGEIVEWAVQMRQFDTRMQMDHLLERGDITLDMLRSFGRTLAARHAVLPQHKGRASEVDQRTIGPAEDNFSEIAATGLQAPNAGMLVAASASARKVAQALRSLMEERMMGGLVRECHGDLHLSNLVLIEDQVTAFDCLEFNPNLRWIDPVSDVAFLFMDCYVRGRSDLAYAFVDAYLDASGDYQGARLLAYFAAYRSIVRAKVAALRWQQQADDECAARFLTHLRWAHDWLLRPPGALILMCGVSGSGKSYLARRLLTQLPALRLRSDVARKALAGLAPDADSESPVDGGLYEPAQLDRVYVYLADLAITLLKAGENVIVDATFITRARRQQFLELARQMEVKALILYRDSPVEVLRQRVLKRKAAGKDASEATLAVLRQQLDRFEIPVEPEPVIAVDTCQELSAAQIQSLVETILLHTSGKSA